MRSDEMPDDLGRVYRMRMPSRNELDYAKLRAARLDRLQASMRRMDIPACLFYGPANIRYATGVALFEVFAARTFARHCLVPAEGEPVLFEYGSATEISARILDDVRRLTWWQFEGARAHEVASGWAKQIKAGMKELGVDGQPLAVDRLDMPGFLALKDEGIDIVDASPATVDARMIKTPEEIDLIKINGAIGDAMLAAVDDAVRPGVSESELYAVLEGTLSRLGGERPFSRLISSGTNTNPWLKEASDKLVMPGDLVGVDTDSNGFEGYVIDVSRTFLCGESPTGPQREAYRVACETVSAMQELVRPGMTFEEFCYSAPKLPEKFRPQRYSYQVHQTGLEDEGPFIPYPEDVESGAVRIPDLSIQPGMVLCLECYAGEVGAPFGVKMEEQVLVTDDGCELLSTYPFDATLLGSGARTH